MRAGESALTEPRGNEPVPGVPGPAPEPALVRRPSTLGGIIFLAVLATTLVGLAVIAFGPWRTGARVIGIAMLVAAAARLLLNDFDSGMLRVRSKLFDVPVLSAVGVLIIVLASVIPNQPS